LFDLEELFFVFVFFLVSEVVTSCKTQESLLFILELPENDPISL
jgi:hypothetical protein